MNKDDILKNSIKNENSLMIKVSNIDTFNRLLENVQKKQIELQEAVDELRWFNLVVTFQVEMDE